MTQEEIAQYATTIDGSPWVPAASLSKEQKERSWKRAQEIAEKWRKAVNGNREAEEYYSELAKGRQ